MMRKESLPDGLEFPSFPSMELSKLISPIIYSQGSHIVYVIQIPLIQSTPYHIYKIQPFPAKQEDGVFVHIEATKHFIFVDATRRRFGKMNYPDLQECAQPNEITYVCQKKLCPFLPTMQAMIVNLPSSILLPPPFQKVCVNK
jgi:hypothetical protein